MPIDVKAPLPEPLSRAAILEHAGVAVAPSEAPRAAAAAAASETIASEMRLPKPPTSLAALSRGDFEHLASTIDKLSQYAKAKDGDASSLQTDLEAITKQYADEMKSNKEKLQKAEDKIRKAAQGEDESTYEFAKKMAEVGATVTTAGWAVAGLGVMMALGGSAGLGVIGAACPWIGIALIASGLAGAGAAYFMRNYGDKLPASWTMPQALKPWLPSHFGFEKQFEPVKPATVQAAKESKEALGSIGTKLSQQREHLLGLKSELETLHNALSAAREGSGAIDDSLVDAFIGANGLRPSGKEPAAEGSLEAQLTLLYQQAHADADSPAKAALKDNINAFRKNAKAKIRETNAALDAEAQRIDSLWRALHDTVPVVASEKAPKAEKKA